MYKVHLFESRTDTSRDFRVEDTDESGIIKMIHGDSKNEYGTEVIFYREPLFEHKRLGLTALEAVGVVYDDNQAESFVVDGLNAMYDEAREGIK